MSVLIDGQKGIIKEFERESARLPPMWPGFDSRTQRHMWAEFVLVLDLASRVFLRGLRFSSLSKNRHAPYLSWLLVVLQGYAWTI